MTQFKSARVATIATIAMMLSGFSVIVGAKSRPYRLRVMTPPGSFADGRDLNNHRQVVGFRAALAFLWDSENGFRDLPPLGTDDGLAFFSGASGINDRGDVVGMTTSEVGIHAFLWTSRTGMRDLGALATFESGFSASAANAVNDRRQVVGYSYVPPFEMHGFLWSPKTGMVDLGCGVGEAVDINSAGLVVGHAEQRAVAWTAPGQCHQLGVLGVSPNGFVFSRASAVNDRGWIVGSSTAPAGGAFLWTAEEGLQNLGYLPNPERTFHFSGAADVNNHGIVVGASASYFNLDDDEESPSVTPFIWSRRSGMQDLNTLIKHRNGWTIQRPFAINDRGDILATGFNEEGFSVLLLERKETAHDRER
jgi:probable HAF family extracellular repeat protein